MAKWYYDDGGQQGPVEEADIRSMLAAGKIGWDTQIWTKGQGDWLPASEVLSASDVSAPAPAEPAAQASPVVAESAPASPAPVSQPAAAPAAAVAPAAAPQSNFNTVVFVLLVLFFWPGAIYYYMKNK